MTPGLNPDGACPGGYPALHSTLTPPNKPLLVTRASHAPVSRLETCRASEEKPTYHRTTQENMTNGSYVLC